MQPRSAVAPIRVVAALAIALALAGTGWQIIANTAADTLARNDPERALGWRPDSARALTALAQQRLLAAPTNDAAFSSIVQLAQRALTADPIDPNALRLVGIIADLRGDNGSAEATMRLAATRSHRDGGAEFWLFDQGIRQHDFVSAVANADAILRAYPDEGDLLVPSLIGVAADPSGTSILDALGRDPPWRDWFLTRVLQDPSGLPIAHTLLTRLAKTGYPARDSEVAPYLDALIGGGDFQLAFLEWLHFLPPERVQSVPFVYNGDFEQPVTGLPFDWQISSVRGAVTEVVDSPDKTKGRALHLIFSNTRVAYRHTAKLLLLSPGTYELDGTVRSDDLITPRGLRWRVACADGDKQQLAESEAFSGTFGWRRFAVTFTVPTDGCTAEWLRLELDTRVPTDQQIVGAFWTDDLSISRADVAAAVN